MTIQLQVLLPTETLVDTDRVEKVTVQAADGRFTFLPRHIDFVTIVQPGLMVYQREGESEVYLAVDRGVLVKRGEEMRVSVTNGVKSDDLQTLRETVRQEFAELDECERKAREALIRLETEILQHFLKLGQRGYE